MIRTPAEYSEWLRSSPDWKKLRSKVIKRAGGKCEACLSANATIVHHTTYEHGRLPPAWKLRAVCKPCHDRIHPDNFGRSDPWSMNPMARGRGV